MGSKSKQHWRLRFLFYDVFFIYPTLIDGKDLKAWNSDIWDRHIRNDVLNRPVKYQASAWIESGNLYVP